ncbi:ribose-5-phosphate isomerase RpiA [Paenibacillus caseinilyticus]|uniref:Ribose-5-phosphate isomerase A n=1 Tax=Paenibacillus mucilaginosus K02 TaxID=997761 RepID=R9ULI4_9BACL|nr:ribose-5-phosphate isomerase RpiA [Paenibacillus mucilaginosus]AGN70709.1 ribose 5-phosphate isomerase [Paenibacillus mucilaginosus K02]
MNTKQLAAEKAVESIEEGMIVGLGTGSTAYFAIRRIAERVKEGLSIRAVASSQHSEDLAREWGIPLVAFDEIEAIDVTIDGADEADGEANLIKGGGGALLREKILAHHSRRMIVIVDESKRVERLGAFPLPVEIVPFAENLTLRSLKELGVEPQLRMKEGVLFRTDNGNLIADCRFGSIDDAAQLERRLNLIPGVVENGLFVRMAHTVVTGYGYGRVTMQDYM